MTYDDLVVSAIYKWRDNKGKGSIIVPSIIDNRFLILGVLQAVFAKNPNIKPLIICKSYEDILSINQFLTTREYEENNQFFKQALNNRQLKVYSLSFTKTYIPNNIDLLIYYDLDYIDNNTLSFIYKSHFILGIFETPITDNSIASKLYSKAPPLECFTQKQLTKARLNSPVEEMLVDVTLPEDSEDYKLLLYYNEYITASLNIFGSFDNMNVARLGDKNSNISSVQVCREIAERNGWNEHLDMTIPFNVQIDNFYNPINIRERASNTFEIIRKRNKLLSSSQYKLTSISKIVEDNPTARILIINKHGDYANLVTDYINNNLKRDICRNYHDKIESIPAVDSDGRPIVFKSGIKKGQQRYYGSDAQKHMNLEAFNKGEIKVLSTNNAPDKTISATIDIVIITSPLCESIESYIYRLNNVRFSNKLKLFTIFIKNSLEKERIISRTIPQNHEVINPLKNEVIVENNSDFVIVD